MLTLPICVYSEDDYEIARERVEALSKQPDSPRQQEELAALAEAMLNYELRREDRDDD